MDLGYFKMQMALDMKEFIKMILNRDKGLFI